MLQLAASSSSKLKHSSYSGSCFFERGLFETESQV